MSVLGGLPFLWGFEVSLPRLFLPIVVGVLGGVL